MTMKHLPSVLKTSAIRTVLLAGLLVVLIATAVAFHSSSSISATQADDQTHHYVHIQGLDQAYNHAHPSFAPGTPRRYVDAVEESLHGGDHLHYNASYHWNSGVTATGTGGSGLGDSVTLTWSIIPDGTSMPSAGEWDTACNSSLIADLDARWGAGTWLPQIQAMFDEWAAISGNTYIYEPNDDGAAWPTTAGQLNIRGDVRIGGCTIDGNSGILAYNFYPSNGDMKIDSPDPWYNGSTSLATRFKNVIAHEHGHGLGIAHVCPTNNTKLMEPYVTTAFLGPQHDDTRAVQRLYGDPNEAGTGNDTAVTATNLGAPADNTPTTVQQVSIDSTTDTDWYTFTTAASKQIDLTLTPVGYSYEDGDETSGSCQAGPTIDSSATVDLRFDIIDSDGSTVLYSGNLAGAGETETAVDLGLGSGGTKYIRVSGSATDDVQLYDLSLTLESLNSAVPIIDVNPALLEETLPTNAASSDTLTISNVGGDTLNWQFTDGQQTTSQPMDTQQSNSEATPSTFLPGFIDQMTGMNRPRSRSASQPVDTAVGQQQITLNDINLRIDDGSYEFFLGAGAALWVNRFTPDPADYPFQLEEIQVLFTSLGAAAGETVNLYVFEDLDGDGDPRTGAVLRASELNVSIPVVDDITFSQFTLSTPVDFTQPGDIILGVQTVNPSAVSGWPIALDMSAPAGRSWINWDPNNLSSLATVSSLFGSDGNFLIRGIARKSLSCTLPSQIPWLSASLSSGTLAPSTSDSVTIGYNSSGLTAGVYEQLLCISSNDPAVPLKELRVRLTVDDNACIPATEAPSVTLTTSGSDARLDWADVANATGYEVYSGTSPYFTPDANTLLTGSPTQNQDGSWSFTHANALQNDAARYYIVRATHCGGTLDGASVGYFLFNLGN